MPQIDEEWRRNDMNCETDSLTAIFVLHKAMTSFAKKVMVAEHQRRNSPVREHHLHSQMHCIRVLCSCVEAISMSVARKSPSTKGPSQGPPSHDGISGADEQFWNLFSVKACAKLVRSLCMCAALR